MKILIFGSSGRTGKQLIHKTLEEGWEVTAFARNPDSIHIHHPRLAVFQGDATNERAVESAIMGKDVVLSAVGSDLGQTNLRQKSMENIVVAMQKYHVRRVIGIGGMGVLQASDTLQIFQTPGFPKEYVPVSQDHNSAFEALNRSGLDFTFVCPPMINDGPATGKYSVSADYPPKGDFVISTGDLAEFMVHEVKEPWFIGKRVGIASQPHS
jgi:putative NADH-flavin reductase